MMQLVARMVQPLQTSLFAKLNRSSLLSLTAVEER
jgi:hypothetical protein